MSRRAPAPPTSAPEAAGGRGSAAAPGGASLSVVALGAALLAVRPWIPGSVAGAALPIALVVAGLLAPAPTASSRPAPLGRAPVLLVGLAGLGAASLVAGAAPPLHTSTWTLPLALVAAVGEEALFRRHLFGVLERVGAFAAIGGAAVAFAIVHLPSYGPAALPIDLGAGLVFGWQRWASGDWRVAAATHALANLAALVR
ncbi:MAG: hypothetical protein KatS3mg013_0962 [Actinomycetota bacterium]|nr:MAG: hypothetical protein KatS3mg013_0962 [Actinomycetota bacterium]